MNDINIIICPDCGKSFPITEALSHQLEEKYKKDLETKLLSKQKEIEERTNALLQQEKVKILDEAMKQAKESAVLELEDLKKQNLEKEEKLKQAMEAEIKLRQERRELEEQKKSLELEVIRKVDEEKKKIEETIQKEVADKFRIQELENVKKIQDLQKALEEAQRKAAAGSVQVRGEVQELDLEELLRSNFIYDEIREVPKGINGADVIQEVRDNRGRSFGTIVWESKHTKNFNEGWISKLKDDMILAKGKCAILVSETLPDDIGSFAWRNGVWVTGMNHVLELTMVLRMNLIEIHRVEKMNEGKGEKMELVYSYLSSNEFRNKIQAVVETFITMRTELDQEKRAFQRIWSNREKQITRMVENTANVIGDLQGILGGSMPRIEGMDLPGIGIDLPGLGI